MRWPLQPLLDQPGIAPSDIRRAVGLSGTAWNHALDHGLTDTHADRAAIRLGHMPHNVWPDWIDAALTPLDRQYLAGGWRQAWEWNETRRAPETIEVAA